jgi:hypothetical protein
MNWTFAMRSPSEQVFVPMERQYELESLRRSIAMLRVGAPALDREAAMVLVRDCRHWSSRSDGHGMGWNGYLTDGVIVNLSGSARPLSRGYPKSLGSASAAPYKSSMD